MVQRRFKRLVCFAVRGMMPRTPDLPGAEDTELEELVDELLADAPLQMRLAIVGSSALFVLAPPLTIGVPLPAHALPTSWLDRHAYRMATHRLYLVRQAAFAVKMVGGFSWGRDPAVRERIGLPPYGPDPRTWRTA